MIRRLIANRQGHRRPERPAHALNRFAALPGIEDTERAHMRPINELRMTARWKFGGALAAVVREPEDGEPRSSCQYESMPIFRNDATIGLDWREVSAVKAQP